MLKWYFLHPFVRAKCTQLKYLIARLDNWDCCADIFNTFLFTAMAAWRPSTYQFEVFIVFQACKNFYDDGVCKQECPPMQIYNPTKYRWERNPDGKYAYGATCVKDCPEHLLKDNGACVRGCPPKKKVKKTLRECSWVFLIKCIEQSFNS